MAMEIMRDPRVRTVEWKDLVAYKGWEVAYEVCISAPWLVLSLWMAYLAQVWAPVTAWSALYYVAAAGFSFVFFLTGLRQVHNAYHYSMGIPKQATALSRY